MAHDANPQSASNLRWPPESRALASLAGSWLLRSFGRDSGADAVPAALLHANPGALLEHARNEGLAPVLHLALRSNESVPRPLRTMIAGDYYSAAVGNAVISADLARIVREFKARSIPIIVLKGAFLVHAVYDNIAVRRMDDVDLLVERTNVPDAHRIFKETFGMRSLQETDFTRPPEFSRFTNSAYYLPLRLASDRASSGTAPRTQADMGGNRVHTPGEASAHSTPMREAVSCSVHLHWHLVNASYPLDFYVKRLDMDRIWRERCDYAYGVAESPCADAGAGGLAVPVSGEAQDRFLVPGLAPHHLLLHLCEHGLKHGFSELRYLVDIGAALLYITGNMSNLDSVESHPRCHAELVSASPPPLGKEILPASGGKQVRDDRKDQSTDESNLQQPGPESSPGSWLTRFADDAKRFNLDRAAYLGLRFASTALGIPLPAGLCEQLEPPNRYGSELLFERLFFRGVRKVGLNWLAYSAMMRGWLERLRFVGGAFWPIADQRTITQESRSPIVRNLRRIVRGVAGGIRVVGSMVGKG